MAGASFLDGAPARIRSLATKRWIAWSALLALGCHDGSTENVCATQGAIVDGDSEVLASLGPAKAAIGRLETPGSTQYCSAAFIAPHWLVTAKHCAADVQQPIVSFSIGDGAGLERVSTSVMVAHPERDVMLVRLADAESLEAPILPIWSDDIDSRWIGREVTLAGYGADANGQRGNLAAVRASLINVDSTSLKVDSDGDSGACEGDSGGPLLWTDDSGTIFSLGVLRRGSTSCRGTDEYERLGPLRQWLDDSMTAADAEPCAGVSVAGTCEGHLPHYCKDGLPVFDECPSGQACGWNAGASGIRCVTPESDACQGALDGRCDGDDLLTCDQGQLRRTRCGPCAHCVRTPLGGARCE